MSTLGDEYRLQQVTRAREDAEQRIQRAEQLHQPQPDLDPTVCPTCTDENGDPQPAPCETLQALKENR